MPTPAQPQRKSPPPTRRAPSPRSPQRPATPGAQSAALLNQPNLDAKTAKVAKTALTLRQLATAAAALRQIPGGGKAADGILTILDRAVNKGGKFYVSDGKLKRTTPPQPPREVVGVWPWLVAVAPWAMRGIGPAVTAARVGLGRFGGAIVANLRTATTFLGSKIAPILARVKNSPAFQKVASLASKALTAAAVLLGLQGAAKLVMPGAAKAADDAAAAAIRKARRAAAKTADAAAAVPEKVADWAGSAFKWGAVGLGLLFVVPKLLER
jgi:hypothetical protein